MRKFNPKVKNVIAITLDFLSSFFTAIIFITAVIFILIKVFGWHIFSVDSPSTVSYTHLPGLYFLKIYREMGGEIITIGSDAHVEDRVGLGVDYAVGLLKEAGFKAISSFEKRKVSFIDI